MGLQVERNNTMSKGTQVYKDIDNNGPFFTVYVDGQCIGTFLEDDTELTKHIETAGQVITGLDNRE